MLIIIPLIGLLLLYLIWQQRKKSWRDSVLLSAISCSLLITASTELLSLFNLINKTAVALFWSVTCIVLALIYYRQRQQVKPRQPKYYSEPLVNNNSSTYQSNTVVASPPRLKVAKPSTLPSTLKLFLGGIGAIVAIVGAVATIAPPNNWDSMTYHMTRIMHWMQNGNVAHYPTNYPPQLYHPPFAEFAIMHLQILSGGDRFANLVQWLAMVGSIIATSSIAKQLGADKRGQIFTAVVTATIPMGILQGSSTQNDYVVAFWLTCVVYYILVALTAGFTQGNNFKIAASFGLGMFTKTTASLFAFPFLVWLFYIGLKRLGWKIWQLFLTMAVVVNAIVFGHYLRNFQVFGSILGAPPKFTAEYKAEIFGIRILISNIVKNLSIHLGTPIPKINNAIEQVIQQFHNFIGIELAGETGSSTFFWVSSLINQEDMAGNFFHLLFIAISIIVFLSNKDLRRKANLKTYIGAIIVGFVLFCTLVKFQQFNGRHHLVLFVLFAPFVGYCLSAINKKAIANSAVSLLIVASIPWLLFNETRPLLANSHAFRTGKVENIINTPRIEQYFFNRWDLKSPDNSYIKAAEHIKERKCSQIGLSLNSPGTASNYNWEYPLWILLQEKFDSNIQMQHVAVSNESSDLQSKKTYRDFEPSCIVSVNADNLENKNSESITLNNKKYSQQWSDKTIKLFYQTK